jgi:hypothetical protein
LWRKTSKILEELKAKAEDPEGDVSEKEGIYKEIDSLEEKIDDPMRWCSMRSCLKLLR